VSSSGASDADVPTYIHPAYRATLLPIRWAQVKTALTFLHFGCTSSYITCRRLRDFYG